MNRRINPPSKEGPLINRRLLPSLGMILLLLLLAIVFGYRFKAEEKERPSVQVYPANSPAREAGFVVVPKEKTAPSPTLLPKPSSSSAPKATLAVIPTEKPIPILMYHYIRDYHDENDKIGTNLSVSPSVFKHQLATLKEAGYTTIAYRDLGPNLPEKPVIISFDDGYDDAFTAALPALQEEGMKGVFYLVSGFLDKAGYLTKAQVVALDKAGMEIGAHTANHRDLSKMSQADQEKEIATSKVVLEQIVGHSVTAFCYPSGKYNSDTIKLLKSDGFTSATTVKPGIVIGKDFSEKPYELDRIRVTEETNIVSRLHE